MPESRSILRLARTRLITGALLPWVVVGGFASAEATELDARPSLDREIEGILKRTCWSCHGQESQEADLRIDKLDPNVASGRDAETWHDVLNRLNQGEMPPEDGPMLASEERQKLVAWLTAELRRAAEVARSTGGRVVMRRLTRYEYSNTMRDLLGLDVDFAADLPPEPTSPEGFQNNGSSLGISPLQIELYHQAARKGLGKAIVLGDKPKVFRHRAEKSEKVRRKKAATSNRLGRNDRFLVRMLEFPREGRFRVRVQASAVTPNDSSIARMRVAVGLRADVKAPERTLAEVDVVASADQPHTFNFVGRIEEFPLPGHNPKFPGLQITIYNTSPGSSKAAAAKRKNKSKKVEPSAASSSDEPLVVIDSVEFEGPLLESWPPAGHQNIFIRRAADQTESQYARSIVTTFVERAYRRPARTTDVEPLMRFYKVARPKFETLEETMREVLAMALISPDFLYLIEERDEDSSRQPLNDYELATRLSYFLWSTMPDQALMDAASAGTLTDQTEMARQVERMLSDPRSRQFVERFTNQWLGLAAIDRVAVNPEFHPNFDSRLKEDMRRETQLFFAAVLDDDLSCLQLLDADFTWLNGRLAKHYGIAGPRGMDFERVALKPEDGRGGLLTQGSFLLANSNGEDSHPIKRAVWLLDRLLGDPPPPPPPDVPDLDAESPEIAGLSLKRQLEIHRKKDACNNCHRGIDPWGVAFEEYDAVGIRRNERYAEATFKTRSAAEH